MRVNVEPRLPQDLPAVSRGLRLAVCCLPALRVQVQETGELTLFGTGETFLDFALYCLREVFAKAELRVSEPTAVFQETVACVSAAFGTSPLGQDAEAVKAFCEPVEKTLLAAPECFAEAQLLQRMARGAAGWDALAVKSVVCVGGEDRCNLLLNDALGADRARVGKEVQALAAAFDWAMSAGPLLEEPVREVKLRLVAAGGGEQRAAALMPAFRRAFHAALALASPRIAEPLYLADILARPEAVAKCREVLAKRRGQLLSESPVACTPFTRVRAVLPLLDSLGVEVDIRALTLGLARVSLVFDGWQAVPGDPLDASVQLQQLEPAEPVALARDIYLKVRRQKGLPEDGG